MNSFEDEFNTEFDAYDAAQGQTQKNQENWNHINIYYDLPPNGIDATQPQIEGSFKSLLFDYIRKNNKTTDRNKLLPHPSAIDNIRNELQRRAFNGPPISKDAQWNFWAKTNLRLDNDNYNVYYRKTFEHDKKYNKPYVPLNEFYRLICIAHYGDGKHRGRDATYAAVQASNIKKELCHLFVQACPTCHSRNITAKEAAQRRFETQRLENKPRKRMATKEETRGQDYEDELGNYAPAPKRPRRTQVKAKKEVTNEQHTFPADPFQHQIEQFTPIADQSYQNSEFQLSVGNPYAHFTNEELNEDVARFIQQAPRQIAPNHMKQYSSMELAMSSNINPDPYEISPYVDFPGIEEQYNPIEPTMSSNINQAPYEISPYIDFPGTVEQYNPMAPATSLPIDPALYEKNLSLPQQQQQHSNIPSTMEQWNTGSQQTIPTTIDAALIPYNDNTHYYSALQLRRGRYSPLHLHLHGTQYQYTPAQLAQRHNVPQSSEQLETAQDYCFPVIDDTHSSIYPLMGWEGIEAF